MTSIQKRPQVIRDLIELATYMAEDNMMLPIAFLSRPQKPLNNWPKRRKWENAVNFLILI
ncbi:hypothetical protein QUA81_30600 [Microcoleus sp. F6_B4]